MLSVPFSLSGVGADVMQRIAAPMVGGVVLALLMVLVVLPAIFMFWRGLHTAGIREKGRFYFLYSMGEA